MACPINPEKWLPISWSMQKNQKNIDWVRVKEKSFYDCCPPFEYWNRFADILVADWKTCLCNINYIDDI